MEDMITRAKKKYREYLISLHKAEQEKKKLKALKTKASKARKKLESQGLPWCAPMTQRRRRPAVHG